MIRLYKFKCTSQKCDVSCEISVDYNLAPDFCSYDGHKIEWKRVLPQNKCAECNGNKLSEAPGIGLYCTVCGSDCIYRPQQNEIEPIKRRSIYQGGGFDDKNGRFANEDIGNKLNEIIKVINVEVENEG